MRYASRTQWSGGNPATASAWDTHQVAVEMMERGEKAILLTVGDTDFDTPKNVVAAANDSLRQGRTHYTGSAGEFSLRDAIARRHSATRGQPVSADQVVVTIGAQNALLTAAFCIVEAGDEVIVPEPMYTTYPGTIALAGAHVVSVASPAEKRFHPQIDLIAAAITPRTKAIFLATPNNPTGAVYTAEELRGIAILCQKHDLWLVSDEVYGDLIYEGIHVSPASLPGMAERTITIGSLSKSHAMAGWRLGWMVAPRELTGHAERLTGYITYGIPTFVQDAAIVALETAPHGVPEMKAAYLERRRRFCDRLDQIPGMTCHRPEGGMFVMLDIRATGLSAYDFAMGLVREQAVAVLPADGFGPSAAGYLRINLGAPDHDLDEAATRISSFALDLSGVTPG
jgi:arginine:pyruvate transaminase